MTDPDDVIAEVRELIEKCDEVRNAQVAEPLRSIINHFTKQMEWALADREGRY